MAYKTLGTLVRKKRGRESLRSVSKRCHVPVSSIHRLEYGRRVNFDSVMAICSAVGISLDVMIWHLNTPDEIQLRLFEDTG